MILINGNHEQVDYGDTAGIRLYHNNNLLDFPLHWHTAMEIIMPIHNIYTVKIGGHAEILEEGDIVVIPSGTLHELIAPKEDGERIILLIDYGLIANIEGMSALRHTMLPYTFISKKRHPFLNAALQKHLQDIDEQYNNVSPYYKAGILASIIHFLVAIGRADIHSENKFSGTVTSKRHEYIDKFNNICAYITEHCTEDISVEDMALRAGFSKYHFSRLFKEFTGISCHEYLMLQRLTLAKQLLNEPDIGITEVSMRAGFNSISSFIRFFKAQEHCTPTEYKKLNKGGSYNMHGDFNGVSFETGS